MPTPRRMSPAADAAPLPSTISASPRPSSLYFPGRAELAANRKSIIIDNLRNLSMTLAGNTHLRDENERCDFARPAS
jgi:hypothetical protein